MEATERAVVRLTEHHTEKVGDAIGECEPLLEMLRKARYPNLGRTKGGGGSGDMFDVKAVEMYETIDAGVRAWLNHFREHSTGDLLELTKRLHVVLQTESNAGRLEDQDRMFGMFETWVERIEDHFDPPHEYELTGACPECDTEHVPDGDEPEAGERDERPMKRALRVNLKPGHAVIPECFSCGAMWATRERLIELSEALGDVVDWAALRELAGEEVDLN